MRHLALFISILLGISTISPDLGAGGSGGRQTDTAAHTQSRSGPLVRVDVNTVFLNVSVRDRYNHSIAHLRKEDFLVYEDGVLQEVQQLNAENDPIYALLLLDNSGSTRDYLGLIKDAAIDFTHRMKPSDQIAVASFNSLVDLLQDFTDDRQMLERAIGKIEPIGGTALYDSLWTSINIYMRGIVGRSAIVVFTDGFDNQLEGRNSEGSRTPFEVLYRRIQEVEPVIYTIFLNTGQVPRVPQESSRRTYEGPGWPWPRPQPSQRPAERPSQGSILETAKRQLSMIAEQTGGRMYTLVSIEGLAPAYAEISDDLSARYQLAYNPTNISRDGTWRQIRIKVNNHPEAVILARKGYFATEHPYR